MGKYPTMHKKQIIGSGGGGSGSWTVDGGSNSGIFCDRCSVRLRRICNRFSVNCIVVLILGFAVLLSWIFWIIPASHRLDVGYDAADSVKRSGRNGHIRDVNVPYDQLLRRVGLLIFSPGKDSFSCFVMSNESFIDEVKYPKFIPNRLESEKASFKLQKGVPELNMHIKRLEYDIYGEISVPDTKVVLLSMHKSDSNYTDVVFGVLSNLSTTTINQVDQSLLRSLFIELFLQQSNLTLTTALYGQTSDFEIVKFPGGLTLMPTNPASIWRIPNVLFNFILNNSITEIQENSYKFSEELKHGLRLGSHEIIYVQVSNKNGSTLYPQVTVHASVISDSGSLLPKRLKELAAIITGSRANNLGLDCTVFGDVKSVSLSSYMRESIEAASPTPAPAPSPGPNGEPSSPPSAPSVSHPHISRPESSPTHLKGYSSPAPAPHLPPKDSKSRLSPAFPPASGLNFVISKSSRVMPFPAALASQHLYGAIWLWGALAVIIKFML